MGNSTRRITSHPSFRTSSGSIPEPSLQAEAARPSEDVSSRTTQRASAHGTLATYKIFTTPAFQNASRKPTAEQQDFSAGGAVPSLRVRVRRRVERQPQTVFEVTADIADIVWKVNIANKKSNKTTAPATSRTRTMPATRPRISNGRHEPALQTAPAGRRASQPRLHLPRARRGGQDQGDRPAARDRQRRRIRRSHAREPSGTVVRRLVRQRGRRLRGGDRQAERRRCCARWRACRTSPI